ncbi:hypothetical protein LQZ18_08195 [Lachnospiraceae bacterium ZAX-1]
MNNENGTNGKAIASFVLGILAFLCVFSIKEAWVGVILGIIGIVLGVNARKEQPSGMATAGIVLSIISIGICAVVFLACVACVGGIISAF